MVSNIHFQQIFFSKIERLDIFFRLHVSFIPKENELLHVMFDDVASSYYTMYNAAKVLRSYGSFQFLNYWQMSHEELYDENIIKQTLGCYSR